MLLLLTRAGLMNLPDPTDRGLTKRSLLTIVSRPPQSPGAPCLYVSSSPIQLS